LQREQRLFAQDDERESNVDFRLPYDQVVAMWRECMAKAYTPEALFARYEHQLKHTYPNRIKPPNSKQRASWANIKKGLSILQRIIWEMGVRSDYRRQFWKFAWPLIKRGQIEHIIGVGIVAHHLILFAREASAGRTNASNYSAKLREPALAPAE
jgi:hypothetical protein